LVKSSEEEVLKKAALSASVTHDHPKGGKGEQATALAVFMARTGGSKDAIRSRIAAHFGYDLDRTVEVIRPDYKFNESGHGTVPEALVAFFDSSDYESAIRLSISLGGDSDTLACITGGIAEAFYKEIPRTMIDDVMQRILSGLRSTVIDFQKPLPVSRPI